MDDVLWKEAGCSSELDYTEQTSWMLFLKYLDDLEVDRAGKAELRGLRRLETGTPLKLTCFCRCCWDRDVL
ncbi:type I restriction-modification system subunit M N-terminal domain-containing protein [Maridesulfovibrio ferrireducens]|uniref:type I restriction-modification system subunit M N-terminal domain-containing protein n=1 Tax=Maridesulfovibrio ferrireducens TaxID=246191 RepID=UPI0026E972D7|nr:type I restriction-modification system subunit M N-terminal domain-containing protein [Maridesulfovibrio ferrireducens]